ncbi:MAG TPA: dihydropteroate synthase [Candidatus Polarisedimenticolaceae bacterium]|nr:dihydropteroate synthase [Candidatus Polarisedimenticolaceae bacterium]
MDVRPGYEIRFADGGSMPLGARTRVMGVLNVTPDSFSDGGRHADAGRAADAARRMIEEGADLIDVGGESSRPGAQPVDAAAEIERVVPVIERIRRASDVRLSIDTTKPEVAVRALDAGADVVNDIGACRDPKMLELVLERRVPVVLMHMRGDPPTMQDDTAYDDVVREVVAYLEDRVDRAIAAGVKDGKILVDPGIGFGKSTSGNLSILRQLSSLNRVGRPIVVGASRKTFIGRTLNLPVEERLEGSLAAAALASAHGAHVIRAHDVEATVRVVRMIDAIRGA